MAMATEFIVISTVRETPFGGKNNTKLLLVGEFFNWAGDRNRERYVESVRLVGAVHDSISKTHHDCRS